jgi:hypothetical protein
VSQLKETVIIINTARGVLVDAKALAAFLWANTKATALLDVHDPEPFGPDYPLLGLPNANLSPHLAAATATAHANMSWVVRDVVRVLRARIPSFRPELMASIGGPTRRGPGVLPSAVPDASPTTPTTPATPAADSLDFLASLRGRFLAFEGPDGSGKSTQLTRLVEACKAAGLTTCHVREPGGTAVGERSPRHPARPQQRDDAALRMLLYMASRRSWWKSASAPPWRGARW